MSKELLKQQEKSVVLYMGGEGDDKTREKLIENIVDTISQDTPNKAVILEVELLSAIQICQRSGVETVPVYVNRYNRTVARYVNQTAELSEFAERQFSIIMLRNARLSLNTT